MLWFVLAAIVIFCCIGVVMLAKSIDKTQIVDKDTRKSATSSIVRGAVGGALFGTAGAVGGAMSGKNKSKTTFLIIYKDGKRETRTVQTGNLEYKFYMHFIGV